MFMLVPTTVFPQGIPLYMQWIMPFRPATLPATLSLCPDADPEDDPAGTEA